MSLPEIIKKLSEFNEHSILVSKNVRRSRLMNKES